MLRRNGCLIVALGLFAFSNVALGDVFVSGTVDLNPNVQSTVTTDVRQFTGFGGFSFTNLEGSNVRAVGYAITPTVTSGTAQGGPPATTTSNLGTNIVAVFALSGTFTGSAGPPTTLGADFDPITGGGVGQIRFYQTSTNVTPENPATWVPNIADLNQGLIAVFDMVARPTDMQTGAAGFPVVNIVDFINEAFVNTANTTFNVANPQGTADVKFELNTTILPSDLVTPSLYPLFTYGPGDIVNPLTPTLYVNLREDTEIGGTTGGLINAAGLTDLGTIFDTFTQLTGGFLNGGTYDPANPIATGDTSQAIAGGSAIPGSQVRNQEVPEPASILLWGALTVAGGVYGARRRMKANA